MQAVFQDPWSSLNPRMTVGRTIAESLIVTGWERREDRGERVRELLRAGRPARGARAALSARVQRRPAPAHRARGRARVPAQADRARRAGLGARRVDPRADHELLKDIQAQDNVAYLLVAHDLATVRYMADHTVVMYLGKIVEYAPTRRCSRTCAHPYTKALFSAVLLARPGQRARRWCWRARCRRRSPAGRLPLPHALPLRDATVLEREPVLREVAPGHQVACHLYEAGNDGVAAGARSAVERG